MRKRYSRSYTVLSFLTMFSYREQPFCFPFFFIIRCSYFKEDSSLFSLHSNPYSTITISNLIYQPYDEDF